MLDHELVRLLDALRSSHPDIRALYMQGQCYNLFKIIRAMRPDAIPHYSMLEGHVYTKVGAYFYDIRGVHYKLPKDLSPLDHNRGHKPHRWGRNDQRRLVFTGKEIK